VLFANLSTPFAYKKTHKTIKGIEPSMPFANHTIDEKIIC
jgi:hypothetical protein